MSERAREQSEQASEASVAKRSAAELASEASVAKHSAAERVSEVSERLSGPLKT